MSISDMMDVRLCDEYLLNLQWLDMKHSTSRLCYHYVAKSVYIYILRMLQNNTSSKWNFSLRHWSFVFSILSVPITYFSIHDFQWCKTQVRENFTMFVHVSTRIRIGTWPGRVNEPLQRRTYTADITAQYSIYQSTRRLENITACICRGNSTVMHLWNTKIDKRSL